MEQGDKGVKGGEDEGLTVSWLQQKPPGKGLPWVFILAEDVLPRRDQVI